VDRAIFRANPGYELVVWDRLSPGEQAVVSSIDEDPDRYGLLRPLAGTELDPHVISQDTALLYLTMQVPGPVPAYARTRAEGRLDDVLARLVLDHILEVEADGGFVSGPEAHELLLPAWNGTAAGRGRELSIAALRYGQALGDVSLEMLAFRLYLYGRRPASPRLQRRLGTEEAVAEALGLDAAGHVRTVLDRRWTEAPGGDSPWRMFWPKGANGSSRASENVKLYVSPRHSQLPETLVAVADVLAANPSSVGFKVGRDLGGITRPDKLVCYFRRLDDLRAAAVELQQQLDGVEPHGVPFTAPIDAEGLLSWGLDPAAARGESWRLRVARMLAEYLLAARTSRTGTREPWQVALERLKLAGVDPDTWVPTARMVEA